jgi:hypothetical protein
MGINKLLQRQEILSPGENVTHLQGYKHEDFKSQDIGK